MEKHPLVTLAVDLAEPTSAYEGATSLLAALYSATPGTTLQPFSIAHTEAHGLPDSRSEAWSLNLPGARPFRIIKPRRTTPKGLAERISTFAEDIQADVLVIVTHGRGPFSASLRGSVTNHLLSLSSIPILSINSHFRPANRYTRLVFTTDFAESSGLDITRAANYAKDWGVAMTIYNKLEYIGASNAEKYASEPVFRKERDEDVALRRRKAAELALAAKQAGVEPEIVIDSSERMPYQAIHAMSEANSALIVAVHPRHGPVASGLAGGVTRPLLRSLSVPLLIFPSST